MIGLGGSGVGVLPPAWGQAVGSQGFYDRERSSYNWKMKNTMNYRVARGKAVDGTAFLDIAIIGTSLELYNGVAYQSAKSIPFLLRDILATQLGLTKRNGIIPTSGMQDLNAYAGGMTTVGASSCYANGAGATQTVTPPLGGTSVQVAFMKANPATTNFTVDGGAAQNMVPPGGAGVQILTQGGLADAVHTVVINSAAGLNQWSSVFCPGGAAGIRMHNLALTGTDAAFGTAQKNWSITTPGSLLDIRLAMLAAHGITPALLIIELMVNDLIDGATPAQILVGLRTIINTVKAALPNTDIALMPTWSGNAVPDATQQAAAGTMYQLADEFDIPITVDWLDRVQTQLIGFNKGLIGADGLHAAALGSQDAALSIAGVLLD